MRRFIVFLLLVFANLSFASPTAALPATFYIDNATVACVGTYSIANRDCTGTDGNSYPTIGEGLRHITSGVTMYIRTGVYTELTAWDLPTLGNYKSMVTIAGYPGESATWKLNWANDFVHLTGPANNITFKDIHFLGKRYVGTNAWTWKPYSGNVWVKTSDPLEYQKDLKSGCDPVTYACTKQNRNYSDPPGCCNTLAGLLASGTDGDFYLDPLRVMYIYSTRGSPQVRTDMWFTGQGTIIGVPQDTDGADRSNNMVIIDHCTFDGAGQAAIKGGVRWWVKNSTFTNVGLDWNDHAIYATSVLSAGHEAVYENNWFDLDSHVGAALHEYGGAPTFHIFRNNVVKTAGAWGVLLAGSNSVVANNTFYMAGGPAGFNKGVEMLGNGNDVISNNIFVGYAYVAIFYQGSSGLTIQNNIMTGGEGTFAGVCTKCTISGNKVNVSPGWVNPKPKTVDDFRLAKGSPAIDAGIDLGTDYENAFDPSSGGTVSQNSFGAWDIGAYVYTGGIVAPTSTPMPDTETPTETATSTTVPEVTIVPTQTETPSVTPTASTTPTITQTPLPVQPSYTPYPTSTPYAEQPTYTALPSSTKYPTQRMTLTPRPTATYYPTATLQPSDTDTP